MSVPPSVHAATQPRLCGALAHTLCLMSLLWRHLCGRRRDAPRVLWGSGDASLIYPSSCRSHKAEFSACSVIWQLKSERMPPCQNRCPLFSSSQLLTAGRCLRRGRHPAPWGSLGLRVLGGAGYGGLLGDTTAMRSPGLPPPINHPSRPSAVLTLTVRSRTAVLRPPLPGLQQRAAGSTCSPAPSSLQSPRFQLS